jgi:hypothetical protein
LTPGRLIAPGAQRFRRFFNRNQLTDDILDRKAALFEPADHGVEIFGRGIARSENMQLLLDETNGSHKPLAPGAFPIYTTLPVKATASTAAGRVCIPPLASITTCGPKPSVSSASRSGAWGAACICSPEIVVLPAPLALWDVTPKPCWSSIVAGWFP